MASWTYTDEQGRKWDSKLEWRIADWCERNGVGYSEQPRAFDYGTPVAQSSCLECGSNRIVKARSYTPDFLLDGSKFYIEAKGYLRQDARVLLQRFIKGRPDVPIRFVFQRDNDLALKKTPTYLTWAESLGCEAIIWNDDKGLSEWL